MKIFQSLSRLLPDFRTRSTRPRSSPQGTPEDPSEESLPSFLSLESRIFTEIGGDVYLGKEKVSMEMRGILRDQARYIQSSQLWEIVNASSTNEAYSLALIQSTDFDQVRFAKAVKHYAHFVRNIVHALAK